MHLCEPADPSRRIASPVSFHVSRSLWLRGLGVIYLAAFTSLAVQIDGLISSNGILPASEYLARARQAFGTSITAYYQLPTLFWFNASDHALHAACWLGLALSLLLVLGIAPIVCTIGLWTLYLSLTIVGQVFLGYQWDALLLETGLLAILIAPWTLTLNRANDEPWPITIWLIRWLLFRLLFLSGVVKLASGDPAWNAWKALDFHYQTQPLPTWASWYLHQLPPWFHWLSVAFLFFAELVAPFFIFGPRPIRLFGFLSSILLQILIIASGNYGFFNLLTMVLCMSLLNDRDWRLPRALVTRLFGRIRRKNDGTYVPLQQDDTIPIAWKPWSRTRKTLIAAIAIPIFLATVSQFLTVTCPWAPIPAPITLIDEWLEPLRSTNHYGLFAVMTVNRPEIIIEGSDDGITWKPYQFRWKPQELDHRPRFTTPHLPRLDWQMWFAALSGDCRTQPWFLRFEQRLLAGSPQVLALLQHNPFPDHPPRQIRALLFQYDFTRRGSSDWWARKNAGLYCPPITRQAQEGSPID